MLRRARWCAGSAAPLLLTVAIALVVVLQAPNTLAQGASSVRCPAPDAVSMQLRWLKNGQFAGYYAAEAAGYYVEVGSEDQARTRRDVWIIGYWLEGGDAPCDICLLRCPRLPK